MPQNLNQWKFVGILQFSKQSKPLKSPHRFTRSIVKIKASSTLPPSKDWFKAGYLTQNYAGARVGSKLIPLNQTTIFELSQLPESYSLSFSAVPWLYGNLRLEIWEDASYQNEDLPIVQCVDAVLPNYGGYQ
jgi:hypothetical protein